MIRYVTTSNGVEHKAGCQKVTSRQGGRSTAQAKAGIIDLFNNRQLATVPQQVTKCLCYISNKRKHVPWYQTFLSFMIVNIFHLFRKLNMFTRICVQVSNLILFTIALHNYDQEYFLILKVLYDSARWQKLAALQIQFTPCSAGFFLTKSAFLWGKL